MINKIIINAISTLIAMGITSTTAQAKTTAATENMSTEKCYGIAKKGMNDCGTTSHACAGEAKINGSKNEWISLPTGVCNKIVGGTLKPITKG
ncbi:MAG: DUF2282 domain-containing protein [Gammaproteobacteria bacterium]|nr:DUF2282 domain-containing protein [Gammaproteobacteria bacterium]